MKFLFLLSLSTLLTSQAFARKDGVMVDENGLTIKLAQPTVVDEDRWNFDKGTYTNKLDPTVKIKVDADKNGNTKYVELSGLGGEEDGIYANRLYVQGAGNSFVLVSSEACDQLQNRNIFNKIQECKKFDDEIVDIYLDQYKSEDVLNSMIELYTVSKIAFKNKLNEAAEKIRDQFKAEKSKGSSRTVAEEMRRLIEGKCSNLQRYSSPQAYVPIDAVRPDTSLEIAK